MADLLDASGTDADAPTGSSWSAPSGAPTGPTTAAPATPTVAAGAPAPAVPLPTIPTPAPAPTAAAPEVPVLSVPDHQPRQDRSSAPAAGTLPGTFPVDLAGLQPTKHEPLVRWGAVIKTVFWIWVLAALAYCGVLYGPDYYERYFGEEPADVLAADGPAIADEAPAPLAFPVAAITPTIAAATFEVVGVGEGDPIVYEVTPDFASAAARTLVNRPGGESLEVITTGDQALIRRVGDTTWYRTTRGGFPFEGRIDRQQWVRLVDEMFPPEVRGLSTIEAASHSQVAGVAARRMVIAVPTDRLSPPPDFPSLRGQFNVVDPTAPASAPTPTPPLVTAPPTAPAAPAAPAGTDLPADPAPQPAVTPSGDSVEQATTRIEVWVDDAGIVRQALGATAFGVERLTITSTMAAPWAPQLPPEEMIRALDAEAAVYLGL